MDLKYNGQRAQWIIYSFYAMLATISLSVLANFLEYNLLVSSYTEGQWEINSFRQSLVGFLQLGVYIATIVLFIQWFRRAYYNLHQVGADPQFEEGWAAGAWFIPILNLFRPYHIMREIWYKTQQYAQIDPRAQAAPVGWWWGLFLCSNFLDNITSRVYLYAFTPEELAEAALYDIGSSLFKIPAILAAIYLIKEVSSFEEALYNGNREISIDEHLVE
jgi:hypothetical protein